MQNKHFNPQLLAGTCRFKSKLVSFPACILANPFWVPFGLSRLSREIMNHFGKTSAIKADYVKPLPIHIIDIGFYRPACDASTEVAIKMVTRQ